MAATTSRLLRLLSLLQARRAWTGPELTSRLEVTPRTLRRDVDRLRTLGYPITSTTGVGGGYRLGAGSELPPLLLDDREALAVALGLRAAAAGAIAGLEDATLGALTKLDQVMPARLRRKLTALHSAIVPLPHRASVDVAALSLLAGACRDAERLRFDYRARDVPGASHPTIAAALARIAGAQPDDVVWDPFAGSGVELIERARIGPWRELHGTDLDARAVGAARENAERAGVPLNVRQADARTHRVHGLSVVITNPPMGRRVLRARGLSGVLCQVVRNVAAQLGPGGRMVWLSPFPEVTARAAIDAGLRAERLGQVDLGGFGAELQRFTR